MNLPGDEPAKAIRSLAEVARLVIAPFATRSQARADAYRVRTLTQAEIESAELLERARINAEDRMIRRQLNMEAILRMGSEEQRKLPERSDEQPIDFDWLTKFISLAEDISNEDIQRLWARVLAGEISRPRSFSARALTVLSMMSQAEAEAFVLFCRFLFRSHRHEHIYQFHSRHVDYYLERRYGVTAATYSLLREIGLVEASTTSAIILQRHPRKAHDVWYGDVRYRVSTDRNDIGIPVRILTNVGKQLSALCKAEPDPEYLRLVENDNQHIQWRVYYADDEEALTVTPEHAVLLND